MNLKFYSHSMDIHSRWRTNSNNFFRSFIRLLRQWLCIVYRASCHSLFPPLSHIPFPSIWLVHCGLRVVRASILNTVLVLLVRAQGEPSRELLSADSAWILHFVDVCVRFYLVTDQIRHLIEAFTAQLALVRPLIRVREHMVSQIAWKTLIAGFFDGHMFCARQLMWKIYNKITDINKFKEERAKRRLNGISFENSFRLNAKKICRYEIMDLFCIIYTCTYIIPFWWNPLPHTWHLCGLCSECVFRWEINVDTLCEIHIILKPNASQYRNHFVV